MNIAHRTHTCSAQIKYLCVHICTRLFRNRIDDYTFNENLFTVNESGLQIGQQQHIKSDIERKEEKKQIQYTRSMSAYEQRIQVHLSRFTFALSVNITTTLPPRNK